MDFTKFNKHRDDLLHLLQDVQRLSYGDFFYLMGKYASAYELLAERYAPFRVGDRVRLKATPAIDEGHAPGWIGYKHILVAGALGVVKEVDVAMHEASGPNMIYAVTFDGYEPAEFYFQEDDLEQEVKESQLAKNSAPEWFMDCDLADLIGVRFDEETPADSIRRYVEETRNAYGSLKSRADAAEQELKRVRKLLKRALVAKREAPR